MTYKGISGLQTYKHPIPRLLVLRCYSLLMKKIKSNEEVVYNVGVRVFNVVVDEKYYSFGYEVCLNGKLMDSGNYDSDYENGRTIQGQKQLLLEEGEAMKLAISSVFS